ncbi:MAG: ABC transporter permease [Abitibacteriaceae bacterium]|nr:ABC transporter permease [Abditibacteriaceae bacterium]
MRYLLAFLSLRYWLRHRGAFFLATLGVALGLAVFVSVQVANHSVLASFAASLDAISGKANLQIIGGASGLPEEVYTRLKLTPDARIKAAAPVVSRTLYSPTLQTSILIMGVDPFAEIDFRDWEIGGESPPPQASTRGTTPSDQNAQSAFLQFLTGPHTTAISQAMANRYHLSIGSPLQLYVGAERKNFYVVAILPNESSNEAFGGDFTLLDIATAQEALAQSGRLSQIDLIVDEVQLDAVKAALRKNLPADAIVQRPAQRGADVSAMLAAFQLNLSALSCIAIFVGAFLIYNSIAIAVVRRRAEVGILRSFGTGQSQLMRLFLVEAAVIGLVGSIVGMLLGIALAHFTLQAVSTTISALYIAVKAKSLSVPLWLWWGAPLGGTVLSILSALPAAHEAANTPPRAAMLRVTLHQATERFAYPMAMAGVVSLSLAFVLCQPFISGRTVFAGFAAAFLTLSGFALLTPVLTLWGSRVAQVGAGATFGIEGTLAGSYLRRALNRSSLVIAALMVSLAMLIGLSVMVGSFRATVAAWVGGSISADLYVAPARGFAEDPGPGLPREVVQYVTTMPSARFCDTLRGADAEINHQPIYIAANVLPGLVNGERKTRFLETLYGDALTKRAYAQSKIILVSERFKNLLGYRSGQTLTLTTPSGPIAFLIGGVFYDYTPNECLLYMPQTLYRKYWHDYGIDGIAVYLKHDVSTDEVKRELEQRFGAKYQLTLLPNREIRASVFKTFDQTFAVTYALQLIAIIVAAIGIFDTLIALLLERSRELATLRALGASPWQINKMTYIEFVLIGIFAWTIGVAAGLCLAWELIYVINRQFFGWTIQWTLQPDVLFRALVLALLAAIGAGVFPARNATRRNIAATLQVE